MSQLLDAIMSTLGLKQEKRAAVAVDEDAGRAVMKPLSTSEAVAEGRLVLLVEDNPVNQRVAQMHLTKLGYLCHIANDGCEAVQASECTPYSMILMDCQMPVMDGFEATRAIRKREQEQSEERRIIIAMTANAMKGDRERCLEAGMDDYLSKPISRDRLQEVLDRWRKASAPLSSPISTAGEQAVESLVGEESYFDVDYIRELVGDDDDIVRELLQLFYDSMRDVLRSKMAVALNNRDRDAMRAHAHELKGAAGNIGAAAIEQRCQAIEQLVAREQWIEIEAAMEWLKEAHHAIGVWVAGSKAL
ncbi:MAG: response regulator [Mariprofundales bacterium]|nr:response regulator [Mariprofundales bacterium]